MLMEICFILPLIHDQGGGGGPREPTNWPGTWGYCTATSDSLTFRKVAAIAAETVRYIVFIGFHKLNVAVFVKLQPWWHNSVIMNSKLPRNHSMSSSRIFVVAAKSRRIWFSAAFPGWRLQDLYRSIPITLAPHYQMEEVLMAGQIISHETRICCTRG